MKSGVRRGDGVGIEYTHTTLRGVRLDHREPDRVHAIAEVPILQPGDERSTIDAFVRLRGELGNPDSPTRVGTFPPGTSLQRVDTTGLTGPELNHRRAELEDTRGIGSTVLVDDGPRRWLLTLVWDADPVRTIEQLAERAGFVDATIDPSPVAIGRAVSPATTWVRRDAANGEAFRLVLHDGVPVAAISDTTVGRVHPNLELAAAEISIGLFDAQLESGELSALVQRIADGVSRQPGENARLVLGEHTYPPYPAHDIRAAERQCVALGAAIGAAGLAGRLRPVDMMLQGPPVDQTERPWAIERLTDLANAPKTSTVGPLKRATARVLPRRRSTRD